MIEKSSGAVFPGWARDNMVVRQLQLFTQAQLATMRDRSASRRYSAAAEEFRRRHARHRDWGLARRHAEKLRRLEEERAAMVAPAEAARSSQRVNAATAGMETEPPPTPLADMRASRAASKVELGDRPSGSSVEPAVEPTADVPATRSAQIACRPTLRGAISRVAADLKPHSVDRCVSRPSVDASSLGPEPPSPSSIAPRFWFAVPATPAVRVSADGLWSAAAVGRLGARVSSAARVGVALTRTAIPRSVRAAGRQSIADRPQTFRHRSPARPTTAAAQARWRGGCFPTSHDRCLRRAPPPTGRERSGRTGGCSRL